MKNFIKSIFVGIFNIIPGLSGSALLIIFSLYEESLNSINSFFKNPRKSTIFLFPIALGIVTGTYLFSNIIFIFIKNYQTETMIVFTFLLLGTIPSLIKESTKKGYKNKYLISFLVSFTIGITLLLINKNELTYQIDYSLIGLIKYLLIGIILSFSTIIPGISTTILLSITNLYGIYIYSISTLNLYVLIPILIGFIITTFILSRIIIYLINHFYGYTYFAILGFIIATIPCILKTNAELKTNPLISISIGIIGFTITKTLFKVIK